MTGFQPKKECPGGGQRKGFKGIKERKEKRAIGVVFFCVGRESSMSSAGADPPPVYSMHVRSDDFQAKMAAFEHITNGLGIEPRIKREVRELLCGSKKVVIIDNSESMSQCIAFNATHLDASQCVGGIVRRYDELKDFLKTALPILAIDSPDGVDVYWLNTPKNMSSRSGAMVVGRSISLPDGFTSIYHRTNVHSFSDIEPEMNAAPVGGTPLLGALQLVIDKYCRMELPMHCICCLDGEPDNGSQGKVMCRSAILRRPNPSRNIINFKVCTDKDSEVAWLNNLDKYPGIDISDDYKTEYEEVMRAGKVSAFSYADYIVKGCIGAASPFIDGLDELDEPPKGSLGQRIVRFFKCKK
jgi:hypothetical protein